MTHNDIAQALLALYPGVEWSYDGDGSSLDPVYDGDELVARGLEWHGDGDAPTLAALEAAFTQAEKDVALAGLHAQRDALLSASDYTQLPDAADRLPLKADGTRSTATEWATYRADVFALVADPNLDPLNPPAWPTAPA